MVYMDYVITYVKGAQVIEGKLLALFNCAADTDAVEPVKNFMVSLQAYLVLLIYES